jgi:hypothetical protein
MARAKSKQAIQICRLTFVVQKWAYYAIAKKRDGSTGGGSNDSFFEASDNDSNLDEEESEDGAGEWGQVGGKGGDFVSGRGEDDTGNTGCGGKLGTSLGVDPSNLFGQVVAGVDGLNGLIFNVDEADLSVRVAATASTASMSCIMTSSSGGKWSLGALSGGGKTKKARHSHNHCGSQEVTIKCQ